jgi:RNA polymerase sigma-B factor
MEQCLRSETTEVLLAEYALSRDAGLRDEILLRHERLAATLSKKFARPGILAEDLVQQAWIALIGALDRFDPSRGATFSTYASYCMVGEIKRYFRDKTWSMKVPRFLQEIAANLHRVEEDLVRKLQRSPTLLEMAEELNISEEDLVRAMEMHRNCQPQSLDESHPSTEGSNPMPLQDLYGTEDAAITSLVRDAPLHEAIRKLDGRSRRIVALRYFKGCSQEQVAIQCGISQMHVSRLERRALAHMRAGMERE